MSITAILFLAGFAAGCVLALGRHPVYGLLAYVGALYFDPAGQWWGRGFFQEVRWEFVAAAVTLVAMLIHHKPAKPNPAYRSAAFWGFVVFATWIVIQSPWALDPISHQQMVETWLKFLLVAIMICGSIDSWQHFRYFLWVQVIGCFYLGWQAYTMYRGGRFEGFATNALGEANYAALELVIGGIVAFSLFLAGNWRAKALLLAPIAFIADGIVMTISRSGFLEGAAALVAFNIFTPKPLRGRVRILSVLGIFCFLSLTTANYWKRIQTIEYKGQDVAGVDTGGGRLDIIRAQWQISQLYPFGCGGMCTTVLSPQYIPEQYLSLSGQRASHNTFMTMLVDHGIPGAALYVLLLLWTYKTVRRAARLDAAARRNIGDSDLPRAVLPALAAVMAAIVIGDLFVEYPKLEARVWFVSLLISYVQLRAKDAVAEDALATPDSVPALAGSSNQLGLEAGAPR